MAGFFGLFDYNKPGPGVPKDAPPKSPFIVFFEILQRKFWNLIKVNFMFLIFNIPAILLGMFMMIFFFPNILPDALTNTELLASDVLLKFILLTLMMCVPMVTVGPAQAGFTYIMRNYTREEHAFLWSDFKETALKNFKQSTIISTINFLATFLMLWSIRAYLVIGAGNLLMNAGSALMVILFIVFASMNIYIYPIMITFNLGIKQIYKNALIFAVIKFLPNVGILLLSAFIILLTFGMIIPFSQIFGIILYIFLTVSLIGFLTNFYAYPKLKKYMISHLEVEEEEEEDEDEDGDEDEDEESETDDNNMDETDKVKSLSGNNNTEDEGSDEDNETNDGSPQKNGDNEIKRYF